MSQQVLDLRRSTQLVRRHKVLVGVLVLLGIVAGCSYSLLNPPMVTSTALVVLPGSQGSSAAAAGAAADGGTDGFTATQQVIASSSEVLSAALPEARPAMSRRQLRSEIQIGSVTPYILSVSAQGSSAADAEATANAVARSYVAYVSSASSPGGSVAASVLDAGQQRGRAGAPESADRHRADRRSGWRGDRGDRVPRRQPPGQAAQNGVTR